MQQVQSYHTRQSWSCRQLLPVMSSVNRLASSRSRLLLIKGLPVQARVMANAGQPGFRTYTFYPSTAFSGFAIVVSVIQIFGADQCDHKQASSLPYAAA